MLKNVSGQKIGCQMTTAADGTPFTGSVTVAVTGDAGTQATGSVGSGACTHEGGGYHTYAPSQAESNYDLVAFTFSGTGAISATVQVYTLPTTGILAPTTAGRTLDVSATGEAGIDWANVGSPTTTLALTGTTIASTQKVDVETIKTKTITAASNITVGAYVGGTAAAAVASTALSTATWTGTLATNLGTLASHDPGATLGTSTLTQTQVTGGAYALNSASFAFNAALDFTTTQKAATLARVTLVDTTTTNTDLVSAASIADAVWDELLSGHAVSGSTGEALSAAGSAGDPWNTALPGAYASGKAGYILGTNLDALISSRMATYTQPTGFLAATFPGTVASTTNITGGTITTVTNLTNAPTSGDFTAAMKTSIATELATYDAPTNTEMTAAFTEIKGATWATTDTLEAIRDRGDAAWITATGFSTHSAADVWAVATRALTDKAGFTISGTITTLDALATHGDSTWATATGFSTFNPTTDTVAHVTLVDTCTANTDMRGTDNAALDSALSGLIATVGVAGAGLTAADDDVIAAISALNNLSSADVTAAVPTAAENAAALLDLSDGVEVGLTPRQAMRLIAAATSGKLSGAATTTIVIRNAVADSKDRITATVDSNGNRSAITVDLS